jgi:hypothetical protein
MESDLGRGCKEAGVVLRTLDEAEVESEAIRVDLGCTRGRKRERLSGNEEKAMRGRVDAARLVSRRLEIANWTTSAKWSCAGRDRGHRIDQRFTVDSYDSTYPSYMPTFS